MILMLAFGASAESPKVEATTNDDPLTVRILPGKDKGVFNLICLHDQRQSVRVRIYDASSNLVHEERIRSQGGFKKPFNLVDMNQGVYVFEILEGKSKVRKQVLYSPETPSVALRSLPDDRVRLTVAGAQADLLTVEIKDALDNLIFTEEIENNGDFTKTYNLVDVPSDPVIIRVKDEHRILGSLVH